MKKWLTDKFLPMWAKQTVLAENKQLHREIRLLRQENRELEAYIRGLESGIRAGKKVQIYAQGGEK